MRIGGHTRLAAVIGWPVGHSRSPLLHNWWLERLGIDAVYVPLPVRPTDFERVLRCLPAMGFVGANVTVPHKEAALAAVDEVDALARRIGAVNTIIVLEDGRIAGRNTDAFGFLENLRAEAPRWQPAAAPAVVVGAGGAARAVCVALMDAGVPEIRLVNRTLERAQALAADLAGPIRVVAWNERGRCLEGAGLVVNGTTLGMSGAPPLDLDLGALPEDAVVTDVVYTPLETPLLAAARRRRLLAVDGLGMLLHQARPAFAAWFGVLPEVTPDLRAEVLRDT